MKEEEEEEGGEEEEAHLQQLRNWMGQYRSSGSFPSGLPDATDH